MKTAKTIVAAAIGVAVGFAGGYFVGKYFATKAAVKKFDEKTEEIRNYYKEKYPNDDQIEPENDIHIDSERNDYPDRVEIVDHGATVNTTDAVDIPNDEPDEVEYTPEPSEPERYFDSDDTEPHIIDEDDYGNNYDPDWVCCNLFYRGPGKVYDEEEQLVDIPTYCGYEALKKIEEGRKYVYVRNCALKIDWEIVDDRDPDYLTPRNKGSNHDGNKQV